MRFKAMVLLGSYEGILKKCMFALIMRVPSSSGELK